MVCGVFKVACITNKPEATEKQLPETKSSPLRVQREEGVEGGNTLVVWRGAVDHEHGTSLPSARLVKGNRGGWQLHISGHLWEESGQDWDWQQWAETESLVGLVKEEGWFCILMHSHVKSKVGHMPGKLGCATMRGLLLGRKKYFISGCFEGKKKNRSLEKPLDSITLYAFLYGLFLNYSKQGLQLMPIMKKNNSLYSKRK